MKTKTMSKVVKSGEYITVTPTWAEILPTLLLLLEAGKADGRKAAIEELLKMASTADRWNTAGDALYKSSIRFMNAFSVVGNATQEDARKQLMAAIRQAEEK